MELGKVMPWLKAHGSPADASAAAGYDLSGRTAVGAPRSPASVVGLADRGASAALARGTGMAEAEPDARPMGNCKV
jgi:hypothetical protein